MTRAAARVAWKAAFRLTVNTSSQSASFIRTSRPSRVMPALFTRTSSRPKCSWVWATARWTSSPRTRSATMPWALTPRPSSSATTSAIRAASRPTIANDRPSSANPRAMARPIPRVAPVTSATRPPWVICYFRGGRSARPTTAVSRIALAGHRSARSVNGDRASTLNGSVLALRTARLRQALPQLPREGRPDVRVYVQPNPFGRHPDGVLHRPGRGGAVADDAGPVDPEQRGSARLGVVHALPEATKGWPDHQGAEL